MENEKARQTSTVLASLNKAKLIPHGLPDLLDVVTREVLRSQPHNVIEFISNLLTTLVDRRDSKSNSGSDADHAKIQLPASLIPQNPDA